MTKWSAALQNLAVSLSLLSLPVCSARAQNSDAGVMRREIGELRQTVDKLNTKIESLERQLDAPAQPAPSDAANAALRDTPTAAPVASLQQRWRDITHDMSVEQVEALLGRPQRTIRMEAKTVWYYSYAEIGSGSVVFVQDDGVVDWQQPPFSVWWW